MTNYTVTDTDLISIANSIRTARNITTSLIYPTGFINEINNITRAEKNRDVLDNIINKSTQSYENSRITRIDTGAFTNNQSLTYINIPNCTYVGSYTFWLCSNLQTIILSNCSVIGEAAFSGCWKLQSIDLSSCTQIGASAFGHCSALTSINTICNTIYGYTFYSCSYLTSVSLPNCTTIQNYAFFSCYRLNSIECPNCTRINNNAFGWCTSLASINIPKCSMINTSAFTNCRQLISLYLTDVSSVTTLGNSAFYSTPIGGYSASAGRYGSVFVPASLYNSFITATNWTAISSRIVSV